MCKSNLCVRDWRLRVRRHHWAVKSRMSLSPSHKRWTSALILSLMSAKKPASEGETTFPQTRTCICVYASLPCVCMCAFVWICRVSPDRPCQTLLESTEFFLRSFFSMQMLHWCPFFKRGFAWLLLFLARPVAPENRSQAFLSLLCYQTFILHLKNEILIKPLLHCCHSVSVFNTNRMWSCRLPLFFI